MGFIKGFDIAKVNQLTQRISKPVGIVWLITAIIFIGVALLFIVKSQYWMGIGVVAVVVSQILIIMTWQDAKFGTIPNIIIIIVLVLNMGSFFFEQNYKKDLALNFEQNNSFSVDILTEQDMLSIPASVKRYLKYVGVVGKPKVKNFKIVFDGEMREKGKDYFSFTSEQYNFIENPSRLFFMKAQMFGMTIPGYHKYFNNRATMDIRIFGLFPVVKLAGEVMDKTETVTLFNDMCLFSPGSLIDKRIQWATIDDLTAKAVFTNHGISITANLYFNQEGQLINFISNDRTAVSEMKQYPFLTPASEYRNIDGLNLPTYGEAVWRMPEGDFTYGKFRLKNVEYNLENTTE